MNWLLLTLQLIAMIGLYFSVLYGYRRARRDFFAAMAMQSLFGRQDVNGKPMEYANTAYKMADAMLKARDA
ncbi:MAG: hypothetical protein RL758_77 [Pseudomonadota bacterium]|jgi:hypothetical protein